MPRICITAPGKNPQPYRFPLDTETVKIGRSAINDVVIEHPSVSSHHCEMRRVGGGYILADCDSTNGIRSEDDLMEVIDLKNGKDYEIGDVLFGYQLSQEEQKSLADEQYHKHQKKKLPKKVASASAVAPSRRPKPPATVKPDNSPRNFAIFLGVALLAIIAFWLGLSKSHRTATKSAADPYGRSLWADMQAKE